MKHNFWRSLLAVLAGNLIYFALEPRLPPVVQHRAYALDWGLALDFWICLVVYGLVRLVR